MAQSDPAEADRYAPRLGRGQDGPLAAGAGDGADRGGELQGQGVVAGVGPDHHRPVPAPARAGRGVPARRDRSRVTVITR
ncbi:hypothetical protein FF36_06244 [Frankia torreyi]|uniref:Uncharacterized protein n=1 Tax=Frankia torreyi TaxID=1856 RepID=A0A0D8B7W3_9ACTN|nr:hypothetical protein FF36_06244 [Frankia torreyi]KQC37373.1 hypothetical protein UK82_15230 [Frankia sp. ACN1ag]KQM04951.1 hypothetical protein FF86_10206 [Frankia sp. CpI1-P]